jgi:hypothetical protein
MTNPLAPSSQFAENHRWQAIAQGIIVTSFSPLRALGFGVTYVLGNRVSYTPVVGQALLFSTRIACAIGDGSERFMKKFSWIAPTIGMTAVTLAARISYGSSTLVLAKGLITGVHAGVMSIFSMSHIAEEHGVFTLKNSIMRLVLPDTLSESLSWEQLAEVSEKTETMASTASLVASLALTLLGGNVIIANAVAYTLAPIVKVAGMYVLGKKAQYEVQVT